MQIMHYSYESLVLMVYNNIDNLQTVTRIHILKWKPGFYFKPHGKNMTRIANTEIYSTFLDMISSQLYNLVLEFVKDWMLQQKRDWHF